MRARSQSMPRHLPLFDLDTEDARAVLVALSRARSSARTEASALRVGGITRTLWATTLSLSVLPVMPPDEKPPKSEREQTDESLRVEREKADDALRRSYRSSTRLRTPSSARRGRAPTKCWRLLVRRRTDSRRPRRPAQRLSTRSSERERAKTSPPRGASRRGRDASCGTCGAGRPAFGRTRGDGQGSSRGTRSADEALATRDDFLGIVSHDLRNMLNVVVGSAALIAQEVSRENPVEQVRQGRSAHSALGCSDEPPHRRPGRCREHRSRSPCGDA